MSEPPSKVNRAALLPLQRALLARRLKAISAGAATPTIGRRPDARRAPLSFQQEQLWHSWEQEGRLSYYARGFRLTGALDAAVLGRAVGELVRRHESLRTTFGRFDGRVVQVINPSASGVFSFVVVAGGDSAGVDEEHVRQLAVEEARKPFDLDAESLLRVTLFRLSDADHVLLLVIPHLVSDRWSLNLMLEELPVLCDAFSKGVPSPLPDTALQYGDYAHWQRNEWGDAADDDASLGFWRRLLADAPHRLHLPTDYAPRADGRTGRGERCTVALSGETAEGVRALVKAEGATLFMTCLAAFYVLLHRFTGADDIVIGSGVAGRGRTELEGIVGCMNKFLAYRARVSDEMTFSELLQQVREMALQVYAHQDAPLEKALAGPPTEQGWMMPRRNVGFVLNHGHAAAGRVSFGPPGLRLQPMRLDSDRAKNDLMTRVADTGGELVLTMEYDADLFAPDTITRLLAQFCHLLGAVAAKPHERLACLPDAPVTSPESFHS